MAPGLQKTWQGGKTLGATHFINVTVSGTQAKDTLWAIKDAMVGFNTNPWTVVGSSDSVNSSMDGTDRWTTSANVVHRNNSNDPMSWIVLQQTAIGVTFQVILYVEDTLAADPSRENANIVANSGGYGVANGGTDGATNSIPSASDITKNFGIDGTNWLGAEGGTPTQKVLTCIQSTDGQCFRCVASQQSTGKPIMSFGVEKPRLPNTAWTLPAVMYILKETVASGNNCFRWETMQDVEPFQARVDGFDTTLKAAALRMSGPTSNAVELIDAKQATGNVRFWGGGLVYDALDAEQDWGTLFDWYWCSRNVTGVHALDLDTFPLAGNRTFVCVGDCVWGWLNDSATDLSYT